jgi:hypothetical protein
MGGIVPWLVANELLGIANVPEAPGIVRHAEEDGEGNIGAQGFEEQLSKVAGAAPFALDITRLAQ